MRDIIVRALVERILAGMMQVEEVPEVFKEEVDKLLR